MGQKYITQKDYIRAGEKFEPYIRETNRLLRNDEYIVMHLDGVKFTSKYLKSYDSNVKKQFFDCLVSSAIELCDYFQGSRIAYVYGDEVSIILAGDAIKNNYNNRIQKLCSISSGFLSLKLAEKLSGTNNPVFNKLLGNCFFSSKVYNIPFEFVDDYMHWRLMGCKKLIFDKRQNFENCAEWERFGALILNENNQWVTQNIDFAQSHFKRSPQSEYFTLK